tara:strand:- start:76 stop:1071 length:996 start_codon:yes stop_codon:yes gene_type:complete
MGVLKNCIKKKVVNSVPVWFMRQAGRYLPEFRAIRSKNTNFIELCLNSELSMEITLQPLKRYQLDAAIIFSDILFIPYALGQGVVFEKNFGPRLGDFDLNDVLKISDDEIIRKLQPIYKLINITSKNTKLFGKDLIGFVGATWTIMVYMLNKKSPKNLNEKIYTYPNEDMLIRKIINTQKIHIKNQVENGASIIQIFDSWAGLLNRDKYEKYIYKPTQELVNYTKSLGVEVICFPRSINSYLEYCNEIKPDAISIGYEADPLEIAKKINIPIQGGMNPQILLTDKENLRKEAKRYLDIFKDHPYIFNLGHGILPETDPNMIDYLVKIVKDY